MKKILAILVGIAMVAVLSACGGSSSGGQARLRVVHASADAPAVDVLVDAATVLTAVAFLESSGYLGVDDGIRRIRVNAAGTDTSVIDVEVELSDNTDYTVLAVNLLAAIEPLVLIDDLSAPPAGSVKFRVVHGSPSAPTVDVYITGVDDDISTLEPTLSGVPFKGDSGYLTVPAGTYRVRVVPEGTKTVAIDSGAVTLEDGQIRTAVAVDAVGGGAPLGVLLLPDAN